MESVKEIPRIVRDSQYEWDEIFDGTLWKLRGGKGVKESDRDFECRASSFATNARAAAKRAGIKLKACSVRLVDGEKDISEVYIQANV